MKKSIRNILVGVLAIILAGCSGGGGGGSTADGGAISTYSANMRIPDESGHHSGGKAATIPI